MKQVYPPHFSWVIRQFESQPNSEVEKSWSNTTDWKDSKAYGVNQVINFQASFLSINFRYFGRKKQVSAKFS